MAYQPGDKLKVNNDLTVTASWVLDDSNLEFGTGDIEYGGEADAVSNADDGGNGLTVETEEAAAGTEGLTIEEEPSEVGTAISGTGIAAIVTAGVLAIAAVVFAILKKKKK